MKKLRIDQRPADGRQQKAVPGPVFKQYFRSDGLKPNFSEEAIQRIQESVSEGGSWVKLNDKCFIRAIEVETDDIWYKE